MTCRELLVVAVAVLVCSAAPADEVKVEQKANAVLRIWNNSESKAYIVVQEQTAPATIKRWVMTVAAGDMASVKLADTKTDRVVIAYQPDGSKLKRVLAMTTVTESNFFFSGSAVLYLTNEGDSYYFIAPLYRKKGLPVAKAAKPVEINEAELQALVEKSNKNEIKEEKTEESKK